MAGGADFDLQPQIHHLLLKKGAEVEVSSDEEGFRGAWYRATIADDWSPPKSAAKKRKRVLIQYRTLVTDDSSGPLLEYVDPAYVRPLPPEEYGEGKGVFEENDVVDAKYRDGWWTGVVRKVLEGCRYRVFFDNPPEVIDFDGKDLRPHFQWLNSNWVPAAKQFELLNQTTGSIFSSGTGVEVNVENTNVRDAWFPAVVIKEYEENTFLVKYQSSNSGDEAGVVRTIVDSLHIRPPPPSFADRDYELLETVDIQHDFGWRTGVITKVLAGRKYLVFLSQGNEDKELDHSEIRPHFEWVAGKWISKSKKAMIISDNQERLGNPKVAFQLERSGVPKDNIEEKTPCSIGRTNPIEMFTNCNEPSSNKKIKLVALNGNGINSHPSKSSTEGDAAGAPVSITALRIRKKKSVETSIRETLRSLATPKTQGQRTRYSKNIVVADQPSAKTGNFFTRKRGRSKWQKDVDSGYQTLDIVTRKGRPTKSPIKNPQALVAVEETKAVDTSTQDINKEAEVPLILGLEAKGIKSLHRDYPSQRSGVIRLKTIIDQKKNLKDLAGETIMELSQHKGQRRKRGRPRKLEAMTSNASEDGTEELGAGDVANKMVVKDHTVKEVELPAQTGIESTVSHDASKERNTEVSEVDASKEEVDKSIVLASKNMADEDDQPLSMWFGGMHSSNNGISSGRSTNGLNEEQEKGVNVAVQCTAIDTEVEGMLDGNLSLPFAKKSPVWKAIESMEVFQHLPQRPHFLPLVECKEEYREGSAIGIMVTFASLFEKICSLQFDDCRSLFESTLESLLDIEKHGFDVSVPRGRLIEMLSIKDRQREMLDESKGIETQIMEHSDERRILNEKMNVIQGKITELQEELTASKSEVQAKELEITKLQSHVDAINKHANNARNDFKKLANASWKLT